MSNLKFIIGAHGGEDLLILALSNCLQRFTRGLYSNNVYFIWGLNNVWKGRISSSGGLKRVNRCSYGFEKVQVGSWGSTLGLRTFKIKNLFKFLRTLTALLQESNFWFRLLPSWAKALPRIHLFNEYSSHL